MKQTEMTERQAVAGTKDLSGHFSDACAHALDAADAQLAISSLKTTRLIVLTAVAILALIGLAVVLGCGLYLLDGCLANALHGPAFPDWFAGLARGTLYTLAAGIGIYSLWSHWIGPEE